jgi:3-oxoacyl-[acyl-carrier-protein] synthase-3
MSTITAAITAVGAYVPEYVLSNEILETMVDTTDEWITTRTGIKERRLLKDKSKGTSFLAIQAAKNLIEKSGINPSEIDGGVHGCLRSYPDWGRECFCI